MKLKKSPANMLRLAALASGIIAFTAVQAHAVLQLNVYENGSSTASATVIDGNISSGDSSSTADNVINYSSPSDLDFTLKIDVALTNNPGGTSDSLNVTSFTTRSNSPSVKSIVLVLSDDNFNSPGSMMQLQSTASGTFSQAAPSDNVSFASYADAGNVLQTHVIPSDSPTASPMLSFARNTADADGSFHGSAAPTPFSAPGQFSMSNVSTFNLSSGAQIQFNGVTLVTAGTTPEPEPASFGLLVISGLSLVGSRRRRA